MAIVSVTFDSTKDTAFPILLRTAQTVSEKQLTLAFLRKPITSVSYKGNVAVERQLSLSEISGVDLINFGIGQK